MIRPIHQNDKLIKNATNLKINRGYKMWQNWMKFCKYICNFKDLFYKLIEYAKKFKIIFGNFKNCGWSNMVA